MKWLDMNYYVGNPVELFAYQEPGSCGQLMRILNGHLRVDFEVQLYMILKASLTRVNLLDAFDSWLAQGHIPNSLDSPLVRHGVHEFVAGVSHNMKCRKQDD